AVLVGSGGGDGGVTKWPGLQAEATSATAAATSGSRPRTERRDRACNGMDPSRQPRCATAPTLGSPPTVVKPWSLIGLVWAMIGLSWSDVAAARGRPSARPATAVPGGSGGARGGARARPARGWDARAAGAGAGRALRGQPGGAASRARRAGAGGGDRPLGRRVGGRVPRHRRAAERAHELLRDGGLARTHAGRA